MKLTAVPFLILSCVSFSFTLSIPWKLIKSSAIKFVNEHALDEDCARDLKSLFLEAYKFKPWAMRMLDASTKIYPGMANGQINMMGDYDECLSVKAAVNGTNIIGQYCSVLWGVDGAMLASVAPENDIKNALERVADIDPGQILARFNNNYALIIATGICVPKSCSINNLNNLLHHMGKALKLPPHVPLVEDLCLYKEKPVEYKQIDIFIYCFFITIFLIILASTIYDIYLHHTGQDSNILVSFSIYSNGKKLFSCQSTHESTLDCIDGIKVISMLWVLQAHAGGVFALTSKNILYIFNEWRYQTFNSIFWSGSYGVDNFFTITGLLLTYNYLRFSRNSSVGLFTFYWLRFLRLTPALLATTFIHISILKLWADGPFAQLASNSFSNGCSTSWWKVLVYFVKGMEQEKCIHHGWYVAIDWQLYLGAPLILFFVNKHPKKVIGGMIVAFLIALVYSIGITLNKNLGFTVFQYTADYEYYLYHTFLYHLPSWLIGVYFGYLLEQKKIKFSDFYNIIILMLSFYTMAKLIISQMSFINEEFGVYHAALWNGFARPTWSVALCLIISSCATGSGGVINNFLSWPIFRIVRKLTYVMYLLSSSIVAGYFMNVKEPHTFNNNNGMWQCIIILIITLLCSVPFYLAFEAPPMAWWSFIYKREQNKAKLENDDKNSEHKSL